MCEAHTNNQRSKVRLEANLVEGFGADSDGQGQPKEELQFAAAASIKQPSIERLSCDHADNDGNGPHRWRLINSKGQEHHREDVLDHQDPDRHSTLQRTGFVSLAERLDREHGAGKREGKPDQRGFR